MLIQQDKGDHKLHITQYDQAQVTINQQVYSLPLALTPDRLVDLPLPCDFKNMTLDLVAQSLALNPEVFIIGTGSRSQFLPIEIEHYCLQHQQVIDTMSTASACRTYTLLATEGRRVLTLLFAR